MTIPAPPLDPVKAQMHAALKRFDTLLAIRALKEAISAAKDEG